MSALLSVLAGVLFALGLAISGMTQPGKVVGFLDFLGRAGSSLAFVMVGAIGVHAVLRRLVLRRPAQLYDARFHLPNPANAFERSSHAKQASSRHRLGRGRLLPRPVAGGVRSRPNTALVFVATMVVGIVLERALRPRRRSLGEVVDAGAPNGRRRGA
ncbi:MAG: DUF6691 family protein [Myxococcota bacterium]